MGERSTRRDLLRSCGTVIVGGTAGCLGVFDDGEEGSTSEGVSINSTPPLASDAAEGDESVYAGVYETVIDSVVSIRTEDGQGSGYVFDEEHVVTNHHVVDGAESVQLRFSGHDWTTATVAGSDPYADLAVLSVEARPDHATPLELATESPAVGTEVLVLGTPFGLDSSLSRGVVSGVDRLLPSPSGFSVPNAIQIDASINPGNSGGPMVDLAASVVAVVSAGRGDGIGFGVSAAMVDRVVPSLIRTGSFEHAYLGVRLADVTPRIATANELDRPQGVIVVDVLADTPADGVLQPSDERSVDGRDVPVGGDVVVELDDEPVFTEPDLATDLALEAAPGDELAITVIRDGQRRTLQTTLASRPGPDAQQAPQ